LPAYSLEDIKGGTASENAEIGRAMLRGDGSPGVRDTVLLNAGAALKVYGLAASIQEGYQAALEALSTGKVLQKVEQIVEESASL
jgi:anthranilate phosphoribosyltransferase